MPLCIHKQTGIEQLSAANTYKVLKEYNAATMRRINSNTFGQILSTIGIIHKHTRYSNVYLVVRR
ncbi:DUF3874 domain-containing protein [Bacteroides oleiciplenus]|uniref:DUF3874 domain-containing protein n=1 Tax=Bacteroides oleiciplenus TaxID=626931 RepID=UPI00349F975E